MQGLGLFEADGNIAERLPSLLVQILPDHVRQRRGDTHFVGTQTLTIGRTETYPVQVRGDGHIPLMLDVLGGLLLECIGDLGRLHLSTEEPREGVADRALQATFEALDDAHRHLPGRSIRRTRSRFGARWSFDRTLTNDRRLGTRAGGQCSAGWLDR